LLAFQERGQLPQDGADRKAVNLLSEKDNTARTVRRIEIARVQLFFPSFAAREQHHQAIAEMAAGVEFVEEAKEILVLVAGQDKNVVGGELVWIRDNRQT